jgi:hypothetical protein
MVAWSYPDVVNGTYKTSTVLVMELIELSNIEISTESVKCCKWCRSGQIYTETKGNIY